VNIGQVILRGLIDGTLRTICSLGEFLLFTCVSSYIPVALSKSEGAGSVLALAWLSGAHL